MTVIGIDHVQLAMPAGKERAARDFYQGLLGLNEVPKPTNLAGRGGCWFEANGVKIHLGVDANFSPARKAHPGLIFSDLASIVETLEAAGFPTLAGEPLNGYNRRYVSDPFGNRIELMQVV